MCPCTHSVNAIRTAELIEYLPDPREDRANHFGQRIDDNRLKSSRDKQLRKYSRYYKERKFGWKFIKSMIYQKKPLPPIADMSDEWLWRASRFETDPRYKDKAIFNAVQLTYPDFKLTREALEGLLISNNSDIHKIAAITSINIDTIEAYEQLFFNIRDRRNEALYLAEIVYPNGRLVECMDNYLRNENLANLLMRAGYNNGMADVLHFAGAPSNLMYSMLEVETAGKLEALIMANGFLIARNFLVNQSRDASGLFNARSLIQAAKAGGQEAEAPSEWANAGSSMKAQMVELKGNMADEQQRILTGAHTE